METFKINKHLEVECETYETRYSWGHKAYLLRDGKQIDYKKITYYNRTWESYQFESILECLAESKELTDREAKLFKKKIKVWSGEETEKVNKQFGSIAGIMAMGDLLAGDSKKEKNDWKARMLKAGLENQGLIMPDDWDQLSETDKEKRLNNVIANFR